MSKPENPAAFPLAIPSNVIIEPNEGMTMRDWFATHAPISMHEAAASLHYDDQIDLDHMATRREFMIEYASLRFAYADAMLAARGQS